VKKSNAQVLLRWGIQHEMVVLPKSVNAARIAENADIFGFALEPREMRLLDDRSRGTRQCGTARAGVRTA
jgi:diketogulonate reductase-like aldo/keto reductase